MSENAASPPAMWPGLKGETFESNIELIDKEIAKRRKSWTLTSVTSMDYDDVSQIIRMHIHSKWLSYDKARPLNSWLNALIRNQIRNLIRNIYGSFSRPCLKCAAMEGDSLCRIYTTQCHSCPLYGAWMKSRKQAHAVKLPLPLENHQNETEYEHYEDGPDIEAAAIKIHDYMRRVLRPMEWKIYKALFVDGKSEEDAAKLINYRTTEKGRFAGYRQLKKIRKNLIQKVTLAMRNNKIDIR
jgi:hypothetical protein